MSQTRHISAFAALCPACDPREVPSAEPQAAIRHLIGEHLKHREMLVLLMFQYRPDTLLGDSEDRRWLAYTRAMDAFFLSGPGRAVYQRQGAGRPQ